MKKHYTYALFFVVIIFGTGCNQYKSLTTATKVSQLSGNPFMYNVSRSVLKNLNIYAGEKGLKFQKFTLLSSLSTVFSTAETMDGLKSMLISTYQIAPKKLNNQFSKLVTVKDVIDFVARNGKGFTFYKNKP